MTTHQRRATPTEDLDPELTDVSREVIGSAIEAYALPAVLAAGLSLMLLEFSANPPADTVEEGAPVAQVTTVER